jgi:hypothetical protein
MTRYIWLSFADADLPEGQQFLGAAIIKASNFVEAVKVAHILGINPGGEVMSLEVPEDVEIPEKWVERLLTIEECKAFDEEMME